MKAGEHYLEDFAVGQIFGSGRLRIDKERAKGSLPSSTRSPFTLMRRPLAARSFVN